MSFDIVAASCSHAIPNVDHCFYFKNNGKLPCRCEVLGVQGVMDEAGRTLAPYAVVVDDNPVILLHAADILTDAGFSVFSASSSDQGLGWLDEHGDDVVLLFTNVEIPGPMDGFGLARFAAERWPGMAVLVSSGRHRPGGRDMPDQAVFLPKPFTREDVLRDVRRLMTAKRPALLNEEALAV